MQNSSPNSSSLTATSTRFAGRSRGARRGRTGASAAGAFVTGKVIEVDGGTEAPVLDMGLPDLTTSDLA